MTQLAHSGQHSPVNKENIVVILGSQNDDDGGGDLHSLLATLSYILYHSRHLSSNQLQSLHTGDLPDDLLAGHV